MLSAPPHHPSVPLTPTQKRHLQFLGLSPLLPRFHTKKGQVATACRWRRTRRQTERRAANPIPRLCQAAPSLGSPGIPTTFPSCEFRAGLDSCQLAPQLNVNTQFSPLSLLPQLGSPGREGPFSQHLGSYSHPQRRTQTPGLTAPTFHNIQ